MAIRQHSPEAPLLPDFYALTEFDAKLCVRPCGPPA